MRAEITVGFPVSPAAGPALKKSVLVASVQRVLKFSLEDREESEPRGCTDAERSLAYAETVLKLLGLRRQYWKHLRKYKSHCTPWHSNPMGFSQDLGMVVVYAGALKDQPVPAWVFSGSVSVPNR